ncbi:MAG: IclR family transcriptional regulator [Opitutaceae bacterium]
MKAKTSSSNRAHSPAQRFQSPALERGLRILELLARHPDGLRMSQVAESLDLPANSAFRILGTLECEGYVTKEADGIRYRITRKLLGLAYAAAGEDKLMELALDVMQTLRDDTGETVLIGVRSENRGIVLEQVASTQPVKFLVDPGHSFPLHTSAPGKAFLAFLPPHERDVLLGRICYERFNDRTLDSREKLEAELLNVQATSQAFDRGEQIDGLHCAGAPIFNHRGYPIASIWVTGPSFRLTESMLPLVGAKVLAAAERISARFGYNPK